MLCTCIEQRHFLSTSSKAQATISIQGLTCSASHCRSFFWMVRSSFSAAEAALPADSVTPASAGEGALLLSLSPILWTVHLSMGEHFLNFGPSSSIHTSAGREAMLLCFSVILCADAPSQHGRIFHVSSTREVCGMESLIC